jgi:pyruvate,orthophosphate dikinase
MDEVKSAVALIEKDMGKKFGDANNTLLFSVRSGAAISMPGMMDTVLNVGLNDTIVAGLAKQVNERFAWDCYRRLLQMFGDVVLGIEHEQFEHELSALKKRAGAKFDIELSAAHLKELVEKYKAVYKNNKLALPEDPWEQLRMGIDAVFRWAGREWRGVGGCSDVGLVRAGWLLSGELACKGWPSALVSGGRGFAACML